MGPVIGAILMSDKILLVCAFPSDKILQKKKKKIKKKKKKEATEMTVWAVIIRVDFEQRYLFVMFT